MYEIPDAISANVNPPKALRQMNRLLALLMDIPPEEYDEKTFSLDPYIEGQLEDTTNSRGQKIWNEVEHGEFMIPLSGGFRGMPSRIDNKCLPI